MDNPLLLAAFFVLFVCIVVFVILYFRKRDPRLLLVIVGLIIIVVSWSFILNESINLDEHFIWLVCLSLASIIVILGYLYMENKSKIILALVIVFTAFWVFTFCTEGGSIRLAIALKGYPNVAYSTNLVENTYMRKHNRSYYISQDLINTENGTLSFFECRKFGFLKISNYCG